jgi:serine/threonine protein kinase
VDEQEIENEAGALQRLVNCGQHVNIIRILHHGWLESPYDYYFVDMEFCDINLYSYIRDRQKITPLDAPPWSEEPVDPSELMSTLNREMANPSFNAAFMDREAEWPFRLLNIWTIIKHMVGGLAFLHGHGQVLTDLIFLY